MEWTIRQARGGRLERDGHHLDNRLEKQSGRWRNWGRLIPKYNLYNLHERTPHIFCSRRGNLHNNIRKMTSQELYKRDKHMDNNIQ